MRKLEIKYLNITPPEIKNIIKKALEKYEYVIPTWIHTLYISFDPTDDESDVASVIVQQKYREAIITIHPSIISEDKAARVDRIILHEFIHILIAPMTEFVENIIQKSIDSDKLKNWLENQLIIIEEGLVQDLVKVIKHTH